MEISTGITILVCEFAILICLACPFIFIEIVRAIKIFIYHNSKEYKNMMLLITKHLPTLEEFNQLPQEHVKKVTNNDKCYII